MAVSREDEEIEDAIASGSGATPERDASRVFPSASCRSSTDDNLEPRDPRGENEDLFRRLNERLHALATIASSSVLGGRHARALPLRVLPDGLLARAQLTPSEYRSVRETNRRFLVFPDATPHEPDLETVVEKHRGFWVVEKNGEAGQEAENLAEGNPDPL